MGEGYKRNMPEMLKLEFWRVLDIARHAGGIWNKEKDVSRMSECPPVVRAAWWNSPSFVASHSQWLEKGLAGFPSRSLSFLCSELRRPRRKWEGLEWSEENNLNRNVIVHLLKRGRLLRCTAPYGIEQPVHLVLNFRISWPFEKEVLLFLMFACLFLACPQSTYFRKFQCLF